MISLLPPWDVFVSGKGPGLRIMSCLGEIDDGLLEVADLVVRNAAVVVRVSVVWVQLNDLDTSTQGPRVVMGTLVHEIGGSTRMPRGSPASRPVDERN